MLSILRSPISVLPQLRGLQTTTILLAAPPRKKKKVDAGQEQTKQRRKAKRIEKEIKRISKFGSNLKPIHEYDQDLELQSQLEERIRPKIDVSENEMDEREVFMKKWASYKMKEHLSEERQLNKALAAQKKALDLLAATDAELFRKALMANAVYCQTLLYQGPYLTPPKSREQYESPDGHYTDKTPTFRWKVEIDKKFMAEAKKNKRFVLKRSS